MIARKNRCTTPSAYLPAALAASMALLVAPGCGGGGGGGGSTPLLQGNAAFKAVAIGGFQSLGAGSAYPYNALTLASPTGSAVRTKAAQALLAVLRPGMQLSRVAATKGATLTLVSELNLYATGVINSGNNSEIDFFVDAAGTQPAGSLTMALPQSASSATFFNSYPAVVQMTVNLTAGNLPCKGTCTITFSGPTGANTLVGSMTLTRTNVEIDINAALANDASVTGTITVHESGATIQMTSISGQVLGDLTSNITVAPYGWKGTATINLTTGSMTVNLNTGSGTSVAKSDASGNVALNYSNGTTETINSAYSASLTATGTPGGGTGGNGSATYQAPVSLGNNDPMAINNSGAITAVTGINNTGPAFYQSSATAAPQTLQTYNGSTLYYLAMDNQGEVLGYNVAVGWAYYAAPTSAPVGTPGGSLALNSAGGVTGYFNNNAVYQPSLSSAQVQLMSLSGSTFCFASGSSPNGQIVGNATGSASVPIYWATPSATTVPVALKDVVGSASTSPIFINNSGQIAGTVAMGSGYPVVYWKSPTDQSPTVLPAISGATTEQNTVRGMNASGQIVGSSNNHAVMWQAGKIVDLNSAIPANTGWVLNVATSINDNGWIIGTGTLSGTPTAFMIQPK